MGGQPSSVMFRNVATRSDDAEGDWNGAHTYLRRIVPHVGKA